MRLTCTVASTSIMPGVCCRCNGGGRCRGCKCVKAGKQCLNCLPLRRGHCTNQGNSSTLSGLEISIRTQAQTQTVNSTLSQSTSETLVQIQTSVQERSSSDEAAILNDVINESFETDSVPSLPSYEVMSSPLSPSPCVWR